MPAAEVAATGISKRFGSIVALDNVDLTLEPGRIHAFLVFGLATAMQYVVLALGRPVQYELVLMLPYALTLATLLVSPRSAAPATPGRSDD